MVQYSLPLASFFEINKYALVIKRKTLLLMILQLFARYTGKNNATIFCYTVKTCQEKEPATKKGKVQASDKQ